VDSLQQRDKDVANGLSPFTRLDRMFDEWMHTFPLLRPGGSGAPPDAVISVDEFRDGAS
jgi:HSP20 family protein